MTPAYSTCTHFSLPSHVSLGIQFNNTSYTLTAVLIANCAATIVRGGLPCISAKMLDDGFCLFCCSYIAII